MFFDVTTQRIWYVLCAVITINICFFAFTPLSFDTDGLGSEVGPLAVIIFNHALIYFVIRYRDIQSVWVRKLKGFLEALAFVYIVNTIGPMYNHLTMTIPFPMQDDFLAQMDEAIGVDWYAYFSWVHDNPSFINIMEEAYNRLGIVYFCGLTYLILAGDFERARFYTEIFFFTGVAFITVGAAFPALAAADRYVVDIASYTNFPKPPGIYHIEYLEMLRGPKEQLSLAAGPAAGLVTFPSYHSATGFLLVFCTFRTKIFWPMTIYAIIMIAATPVFGGHYFIDIFVGGAVAVASAWALARTERYRGLFDRPNTQTTTAEAKIA
ncbi:MAG: phosphatase PAP2 family protein [Pseudomonadota bacterium]